MPKFDDHVNYYEQHNLHLIRVATDGHDAGKRPKDTGWQRTPIDYTTARRWSHSGGNLGWCVGPDYVVLDIDPRNGGDESYERLLTDTGLTSEDVQRVAPTVITGSGGRHIYLSRDPELPLRPGSLKGYPGIDIKTGASQVVISGSTHPMGLPYYPDSDSPWGEPPAPAPDALVALLVSRSSATPPSPEQVASSNAVYGCITPEECAGVLNHIDPAALEGYEQWVSRLAAIHHATGGEGLEQAVEWSSRDPQYADVAESQVRRRWDTFNAPHEFPATIHTLLADLPPTPDADTISSGIKTKIAQAEFDDLRHLFEDLSERAGGLPGGGWKHNSVEATNILRESLALDDIEGKAIRKSVARELGIPSTDLTPVIQNIKKKIKAEAKAHEQKTSKKDKLSISDFIEHIKKATLDNIKANGQYLTRAPNEQYYIYTKSFWKKVGREHIVYLTQLAAYEVLEKYPKVKHELASAIGKAEQLIRSGLFIEDTDLFFTDCPHSAINAKNGTIWIDPETGEPTLKPHHPGDYLTNQIPTIYNPAATCPAFDEMLEQVFSHISENDRPDLIRHFWELLGYVIQPRKDIPLIMMWYGNGVNGKTTIAEFITELMGPSCSLPVKMHEFGSGRNQHGTASLEGKLLLIDDDLQSDARLSDGTLKKFSETKLVEINPKHKAAYTTRSNVTPLLLTNGYPIIRDLSKGLQRRMDVMPFESDLTPYRGSDLPRIARTTEMSGILNRALEGLKRVRLRHGFDRPDASIQAGKKFFSESNNVAAFIQFATAPGGESKIMALYSAYVQFCTTYGERHNTERMGRFRAMVAQLGHTVSSHTVKGVSMQAHADDY